MTLKEAQDILEQFRKLTEHGTCPSCGHCPSCGRGGVQFVPYIQPYPTYPWWNQGVVISTSGGVGTTTTVPQGSSWSYTVPNA